MRVSISILLYLLLGFVAKAQDTPNFWTKTTTGKIRLSKKIDYPSKVKNFDTYLLDKASLISAIKSSPKRFSGNSSAIELMMPGTDEKFTRFKIYKSKLLPDKWKSKYPNLRSYYGISEHSSLRLTVTPIGVYAMIQQPQQHIIINPVTENTYMVYKKKNAVLKTDKMMFCGNNDQLRNAVSMEDSAYENTAQLVDDGLLRSYKLAVATTGEYAQFHIQQANAENATPSQQKQVVLSAIAVTINRVNSIYERDFSISLELISNNDDIVYLDEQNDPYSNFSSGDLISENQTVIDSVIGFSNYDLGHVFSTGGGGLASLGSVCTLNKAGGVTGQASPVGDPFDIDYVAHELGHQFGATHTFNNSCNANRTDATAYEPGSGNTIMAYAGICSPNVQNNSDAVFHVASVNQVFNFIKQGTGASCADFTPINNNAPVINSPVADKTIPYGTPFVLEADVTDADNDNLTYTWEQIDNEISEQPPDSLSVGGPNFRSLLPGDDPRRFFPKYEAVLNGELSTKWEVLPWTSRSMRFGLLARDNNPASGQSVTEEVNLTVADAGPFEVTSQAAEDINWQPGETEMITWNVNGTDANGINTSAVNILLSTDGGLSFDTTLATNVPNNGSYSFTVPDIQAAFCRIKIQPVDNYYYAINSTDFAIDTVINTDCFLYTDNGSAAIPDGIGPNTAGSSLVKTININDDISVSSLEVSVNITHTYINDLVIELESPTGTAVKLWDRNCSGEDNINVTFSASAAALPTNCSSPFTGTFKAADDNASLEDFIGESSLGDWKLIVTDFYNQDIGTLESWNLDICTTSILSNEEIEDGPDFSITPNPASGNINIQLLDNLTNDINVKFYDMNGRMVKATELQEQQTRHRIDVSALSSGVYFVKVNNQQFTTTEKLIIR